MSVSMPEHALQRRDPVAGRRHKDQRRQVILNAMPPGTVLQVLLAQPRDPGDERLRAVASLAGLAVRATAAGQVWLVGSVTTPGQAVRTIAAALGPEATVVDQSHGRIRLALGGRGARRVLAGGTGLDLADRAFPVGATAETLFGSIAVSVTRLGGESYEVMAGRSFTDSLWRELMPEGAGREAGTP
jgi:sarcosine oxidase subunit gamma